MTTENDLVPFWVCLPAQRLCGFEDRQTPKRSSLDTQLSAGIKGGFYFILSVPLSVFVTEWGRLKLGFSSPHVSLPHTLIYFHYHVLIYFRYYSLIYVY